MDTSTDYYCYVYKRKDGTPYYIGKGRGSRAFITSGRIISPPRDRNNIFFACEGVSETEAFEMEVALISLLGRKDLGTGILRNRTDGGEGSSGRVLSEESKRKMGETNKGRRRSEEDKRRRSERSKGENNSSSKLTDIQRIEICQKWKSGELQKDLAIYYNVSHQTISFTVRKLKNTQQCRTIENP